MLPSWLANQLATLPATELVIVLDTCESERGAMELHGSALALRGKGVRWPPMAIVYSARMQERAEAGAFASVLVEVLHKGCLREIVGDDHLELVELWSDQHERIRLDDAVRVATAALRTRGATQTPGWETPNQPTMAFLRNPRFGQLASGTIDVAQLHTMRRAGDAAHFLGKASGVERVGGGWFFTGRRGPLTQLIEWLAASVPGTYVVTGPAGSGKSALLGWAALLAEEAFRAGFPDLVVGRDAPAAHRRRRLGEQQDASGDRRATRRRPLDRRPPRRAGPGELHDPRDRPPIRDAPRHRRARRERRSWCADRSADHPAQRLGSVVLVLGVRDGAVLDRLASLDVEVVDLADDPQQAADLGEYVRRRLRAADRYADPEPFAADVAEHADRFLTARLLVNALLNDPDPYAPGEPRWRGLVAGESVDAPWLSAGERRLVAAFDADLDTYPNRQRVDDLLRPLAWARGAGLPRQTVWAALASALSSDGRRYDDADVGWALDELGRHLTIAGADGRSVYRLYHQSFSDVYRARGSNDAEAAIAEVLAGLVATSGWPDADPYVVRQLLDHARAGGVLADHAEVLARVDFLSEVVESFGPAVLVSMLDPVSAADAEVDEATRDGARILRSTLRLATHILATDPTQLRVQLQARLERPNAPFVERLLDDMSAHPPVGFEPLAASFWRAGGPIVSTIEAHRGEVTSISLLPDGVGAATASADGTVKIWDLERERERVVLVQGQAPVSLARRRPRSRHPRRRLGGRDADGVGRPGRCAARSLVVRRGCVPRGGDLGGWPVGAVRHGREAGRGVGLRRGASWLGRSASPTPRRTTSCCPTTAAACWPGARTTRSPSSTWSCPSLPSGTGCRTATTRGSRRWR